MRPLPYEVQGAYERLRREWSMPTHLPGMPPAPPSLELFEEATTRANANSAHLVTATSVASSLLAGRWPERRR